MDNDVAGKSVDTLESDIVAGSDQCRLCAGIVDRGIDQGEVCLLYTSDAADE